MESVPTKHRILIASDIHYASAGEKAEGENELSIIGNPFLKLFAKVFRHYFWMRHPHSHNDKLLKFLAIAPDTDLFVGCGDYSCGTGNIGVQYPSAYASVSECLSLMRQRFGHKMLAICGDHEIGKMSLFGGKGGLRLASWRIGQEKLGIRRIWHRQFDSWRLIGLSSPPIILPNIRKEILPEEREEWETIRKEYLREIESHMNLVTPDDKVILFCHDPTALPHLAELPVIQHLLGRKRIALTIVGHLHTEIILKASRLLSGMPHLTFLGNSASRMSSALKKAKIWKSFNLVLCPSLAGCQWAKDGGWLELELNNNCNYTLTRRYLKW